MATSLLTDQEMYFEDPAGGIGRWTITGADWLITSEQAGHIGHGRYTLKLTIPASVSEVTLETPRLAIPLGSETFGMTGGIGRVGGTDQAQIRSEVFFYNGSGGLLGTHTGAWRQLTFPLSAWQRPYLDGLVDAGAVSMKVVATINHLDGSDIDPSEIFFADDLSPTVVFYDTLPSGPAGKTFYTTQGWGYNDAYLCEWCIIDDTPVHIRHVHLPGELSGEFYPWTTWITKEFIYIVGFGANDPARDYDSDYIQKIRRSDLTYVESIPSREDWDGGGSPGGYTNVGKQGLQWGAYEALQYTDPMGGPFINILFHRQTEVAFPYFDAANDALLDLPFQKFFYGDLYPDKNRVIFGWYTFDPLEIRELFLSDPSPHVSDLVFSVTSQDIVYEDRLLGGNFETGSFDGWHALDGSVVATLSTDTAESGTHSLKLQISGSGRAASQHYPFPADPRVRVGIDFYHRAGSGFGGFNVLVYPEFFDSVGTLLGNGEFDNFNLSTSTWRNKTSVTFANAPEGTTTFRWVIERTGFSAIVMYLDYIHIYLPRGQLHFYQEPIKVHGPTGEIFAAVDTFLGVLSPGMVPYTIQPHMQGAFHLHGDGSLIEWIGIDRVGNPSGYPPHPRPNSGTVTSGLVFTPDDKHVVVGTYNHEGLVDAEGAIWCRNLETGVEGWAASPHPGYNTGPVNSTLLHVGAYHNRETAQSFVRRRQGENVRRRQNATTSLRQRQQVR